MNNSALLNNSSENTKKAEKYIFKYLKELKFHLSLSDNQIIHILSSITRKMKKTSRNEIWWKNFFKKTS